MYSVYVVWFIFLHHFYSADKTEFNKSMSTNHRKYLVPTCEAMSCRRWDEEWRVGGVKGNTSPETAGTEMKAEKAEILSFRGRTLMEPTREASILCGVGVLVIS